MLKHFQQVIVLQQSPSPTQIHIKEPPLSPGSPTNHTEAMYAAGGGTQIYLQVSLKQQQETQPACNQIKISAQSYCC